MKKLAAREKVATRSQVLRQVRISKTSSSTTASQPGELCSIRTSQPLPARSQYEQDCSSRLRTKRSLQIRASTRGALVFPLCSSFFGLSPGPLQRRQSQKKSTRLRRSQRDVRKAFQQARLCSSGIRRLDGVRLLARLLTCLPYD